jgi:hypothetical protein
MIADSRRLEQFRGCSRGNRSRATLLTPANPLQIARDESAPFYQDSPSRPHHSQDNQILISNEQNDVAPGQFPRCSRPISLDNLPRVDQSRQVEADDVYLQFDSVIVLNHSADDGILDFPVVQVHADFIADLELFG